MEVLRLLKLLIRESAEIKSANKLLNRAFSTKVLIPEGVELHKLSKPVLNLVQKIKMNGIKEGSDEEYIYDEMSLAQKAAVIEWIKQDIEDS